MKLARILDNLLPRERLVAKDGMEVTVDAWNKAHKYHHDLLRAALLSVRGWGVLEGLQVAKDGKDIQISAGVAINQMGQLITHPGYTITLDSLKRQAGVAHIMLSPTASKEDITETIGAEIIINRTGAAANPEQIELARIIISDSLVNGTKTEITMPSVVKIPTEDEIDLRFRIYVGTKTPLRVALVPDDNKTVAPSHIAGWRALGREVSYHTSRPVLFEEFDVSSLSNVGNQRESLERLDMMILISSGNHSFYNSLGFLQNYVAQGGIVLFEKCSHNTIPSQVHQTPPLSNWVNNLLSGETFVSLDSNDPLFHTPYRFGQIPKRFYGGNFPQLGQNQIQICRLSYKGIVIISQLDHGCIFCDTNQPSSEIREAMQWGHNLLAMAGDH